MKKIKILLIAGAMNFGGIENQLMHLVRNADKSRFQIDFTTTVGEPYYKQEIEALGSKCIRIPATRDGFYIPYCKALYRVMKDGKYDIVHSHELFHSGMVLPLAKAAGIPHRFVHAHNWSDANGPNEKPSLIRRLYNTLMQRSIQKNATEFIACSTLAGRFLYGEEVTQQNNYHLMFNSVDTSQYIENYGKNESGEFCDDGWINILQVGRFSTVKNQLFTAQIAKVLKQRGLKVRILCAGNNGNFYEQQVVDVIERDGLQEHMLLLGVRGDIDVLARKSAAFLLPSLYEGMPLVLIEAQAAGLPCVVADTFSHEVDFGIDTVKWMNLSDSAEVWTDALLHAVKQPRVPKSNVVAAIERGGFDSKVFSQRLCSLYENSVRKE